MTMNENTIFEKAIEIYHKTGSEQEYAKFIYGACGNNMFLATDICKKVDYYLEFLDNDR